MHVTEILNILNCYGKLNNKVDRSPHDPKTLVIVKMKTKTRRSIVNFIISGDTRSKFDLK